MKCCLTHRTIHIVVITSCQNWVQRITSQTDYTMATRIWLKDTILIQEGPYQQESIYYWQRLGRISPFWQNQSIIFYAQLDLQLPIREMIERKNMSLQLSAVPSWPAGTFQILSYLLLAPSNLLILFSPTQLVHGQRISPTSIRQLEGKPVTGLLSIPLV